MSSTTLLTDEQWATLLDTVYLHVIAWWQALQECGHEVSCVDVHRAIGRGSDDLVRTLLGAPDERCRPFHDVLELIRAVAGRGVQVVYCTSGSADDVEDFRAKVGCDDVVAAAVDSSDVEASKPAPDIVRAALAAVGSGRRTR